MKTRLGWVCLILALARIPSAWAGYPHPHPRDPIIGMILGQPLTAVQRDELRGTIFSKLTDRFAADNNLAPTAAEIAAFRHRQDRQSEKMKAEWKERRNKYRAQLSDPGLDADQRTEIEADLKLVEENLEFNAEAEEHPGLSDEEHAEIERNIATFFVKRWKVNKALFEKYGGRVIFQQAGVEPLDAYRQFLRDEEKKGSFAILARYDAEFWKYFTDERMHRFAPPDKAAEFINRPSWHDSEE